MFSLHKVSPLALDRSSCLICFPVHTSGSATASYLKGLIPTLPETCRDIYLIGQKGLEDELRDAGLTFEGGSDPEHNVFMPAQDFSSITPNPRIGLVVQGKILTCSGFLVLMNIT